MQLCRCPVCHSRISLDQLIQDEAGKELLSHLIKFDTHTGAALINYIALFRPEKRDLANDRALRLLEETLSLCSNQAQLITALINTVDSIRAKPSQPLKNHNYLKRVLESTPEPVAQPTSTTPVQQAQSTQSVANLKSKTAQGMQALEALK